jgi:hypothetical protein
MQQIIRKESHYVMASSDSIVYEALLIQMFCEIKALIFPESLFQFPNLICANISLMCAQQLLLKLQFNKTLFIIV